MTVVLIIAFMVFVTWFALILEGMFEVTTKPNIYQVLSWIIYVSTLLIILFFIGKTILERIASVTPA